MTREKRANFVREVRDGDKVADISSRAESAEAMCSGQTWRLTALTEPGGAVTGWCLHVVSLVQADVPIRQL